MKKCIMIYNSKSGKKKEDQFLDIVSKILKEYDYDLEVKYTKKKGHASKIIKELPDNVDLVISAGGDGTYNEVVSGDLKRENKLLIANLPLGTTNDVGTMYGYNGNLEEYLRSGYWGLDGFSVFDEKQINAALRNAGYTLNGYTPIDSVMNYAESLEK